MSPHQPTATDHPLVDTVCDGLDAALDELTHELFGAKAAARLAAAALDRGDLLEAAEQIRKACDHEYEVLGSCDHCGELAEQIQRAHTGSETADYCEVEGCEICAELNADTRPTLPEVES